MSNSYVTMNQSSDKGRHSTIVLTPEVRRPGYIRTKIFFLNNTFENIQDNPFPLVYVMCDFSTNINVSKTIIRGCSAKKNMMIIDGASILMNNNLVANSQVNKRFAIAIGGNITAINNTFQNITYGSVQDWHLFLVRSSVLLHIDTIQFVDCKPSANSLFYIEHVNAPFVIKNVLFKNIENTEGYPLLSSSEHFGGIFQNVTFEDIYKQSADGTTNVMMRLGSLKLGDHNRLALIDFTITNSTVPFIMFDSITNTERNGSSVDIQNLKYHD